MHMCKTCVAWYEEEAFPDVDACSPCQPYLGYSNKVFRHCLAADDPPVCEGTKQQVPSMALPSRFQTAVKTPACIAGQANHWDLASLRAGAGPAREGRLSVSQHSRISWAAAPIAVHGLCSVGT